jgi:predicted alpha-1,6-mannanase (GH76 family)
MPRRPPRTHPWTSLGATLLLATGCAAHRRAAPDGDYRAQASDAMSVLSGMYCPLTGLWSFAWWQSANGIETTLDYSRAAGDRGYSELVANTFGGYAWTNFLNDYNDDEAWWALAWLKAYDWTGDRRYLTVAQRIFDNIAGHWDDVCGGGVWWSKEHKYKNAITTELFLTLAARLHERTSAGAASTPYLAWALRAWQWLSTSGMINQANLFNDGLTSDCRNNGDTTWTYNQGVVLGGLVELSRITGDQGYIARAQAIADAATSILVTPQGILREPSEPNPAGDHLMFKGVFIRNLGVLDEATGHRYRAFIVRNADSIHARATNGKGEIGTVWSGPFDRADPARQIAGLAALVAAMTATDTKAKTAIDTEGRL